MAVLDPNGELDKDSDAYREAGRYLKHKVGEVTTERHGGPAFISPAKQRVTVDQLLTGLQDDYQLRGKWNERVASTVKTLRAHFGRWRAVEVTDGAVAAFQLGLREKGYRDATINRFCQQLGQSFKLAHLSTAPVIKHLSEVGNARSGFFTEPEIRAVIANLPEHLRDFTLFAYICGMRKGEIQSLRWADVNGDTITLRAENSKNGEGRSIPLVGQMAELMERRQAARRVDRNGAVMLSEFVFHLNGRPIASFRKAWASACRFANVPGRLFHDLRRCAARNLLASGVPQAVAMQITGHRGDSMFRRYAIVNEAQKREALRMAEAYRQQQVEPQKITSIN